MLEIDCGIEFDPWSLRIPTSYLAGLFACLRNDFSFQHHFIRFQGTLNYSGITSHTRNISCKHLNGCFSDKTYIQKKNSHVICYVFTCPDRSRKRPVA